MIIRLFCVTCAYEAAKKLEKHIQIEVPMPIARLADDGRYKVRCAEGHLSTVYVSNLKFELLFEMGLNALADGYPRDAVSSMTSSLERFHEFFWKVAAFNLRVPTEQATRAWKPVSRFSERQLGMYITAYVLLLKTAPDLQDPNTDVKLRNDVIHNGYVPTEAEAISYGDNILRIVNSGLEALRRVAPAELKATYSELSPGEEKSAKDPEDVGRVNILTTIDVLHPPRDHNDTRWGGVQKQLPRIVEERVPHRLSLFSKQEFEKQYPGIPKGLDRERP